MCVFLVGKIASIDRGWLQAEPFAQFFDKVVVGKIASIDRGWLLDVEMDTFHCNHCGENSLD